MRRIAVFSLLAVPVLAITAVAQTPAKPASTAAKSSTTAVHKPAVAGAAGVKLPPGVPPVRGIVKPLFALRYQEIKLGTGAVAEPGKLYEVHYTGWLASDGKKFDSSFDHPDKAPIKFPQGRHGVIPGWDEGFEGMKIGGKRRLFIPYQLAYGVLGRPPVIPGKSDLIFDIELVSVSEMPTQGMPQRRPRATPEPATGAPAPSGAPAQTPGAPTSPTGPQAPAGAAKPVDPTAPTVAPNSAAPSSAPAPSTPPATPPTAAPDKPANPAQPNPTK
jgi:peptidylprolyl isomerase